MQIQVCIKCVPVHNSSSSLPSMIVIHYIICVSGELSEKLTAYMFYNLMFFWLCIMNWLYINYQLDALIIIYS